MIFSIRDDDTNFFTTPEDLEEAYSDIWDICPITIFIIPFVMGNWRFWIKERYFNYDKLNKSKYKYDKKIYPIGENVELINFLKKKIKEGKLEIGIHGVNHKNTDEQFLKSTHGRIENAEFFTNQDFTNKLKNSKSYLEKLFNQKIRVFSPPQNLINSKGYESVINCNLSIVKNRNSKNIYHNISEIGVLNAFKITYHSFKKKFFKNIPKQYSKIIELTNNFEFPHYPYQPNTKIIDLENQIKYTNSVNGLFVLSTHYYVLQKTFDQKSNMRNDLLVILRNLQKSSNCNFSGISSIIKLKEN